MPRGIARTDAAPGVASYTLGAAVSFTVNALTVLVDATHETTDDLTLCEARDPFGGVIYRQPLGFNHGARAFYSLAFGGESQALSSGNPPYFAQSNGVFIDSFVSMSLPPLALTEACTLYVYTPLGVPQPDSDPLTQLDTGVVVSGLYLWIEDADTGANVQPVQLPAALAYEPTMSV